jgi:hypothetical protein
MLPEEIILIKNMAKKYEVQQNLEKVKQLQVAKELAVLREKAKQNSLEISSPRLAVETSPLKVQEIKPIDTKEIAEKEFKVKNVVRMWVCKRKFQKLFQSTLLLQSLFRRYDRLYKLFISFRRNAQVLYIKKIEQKRIAQQAEQDKMKLLKSKMVKNKQPKKPTENEGELSLLNIRPNGMDLFTTDVYLHTDYRMDTKEEQVKYKLI